MPTKELENKGPCANDLTPAEDALVILLAEKGWKAGTSNPNEIPLDAAE